MRSEVHNRLVVISALGVVEILAWGSSFYLPAVLAGPIAADTGWPLAWVVGGLSVGLLEARRQCDARQAHLAGMPNCQLRRHVYEARY